MTGHLLCNTPTDIIELCALAYFLLVVYLRLSFEDSL
jgi:hypothetical protein